ncbi:FG-GAP repeat domain-containing protein [Archangium gephyra]|uniref:FG-GAP repeat domain-containing protein n=1 Tax=Archangium gephyra TaxID=48 RepID=UPI003B80FEB3
MVNFGGDTISVLLGNGAGAFGAATSYATGPRPASIVSADLNQDGKLDLAVANTGAGCCSGSSAISFLAGRGDGTFAAYRNVYAGTSSGTDRLAIGDFDRDTRPDLAAFSILGRVALIFYSRGEFWATTLVDASPWVQDFVTADFDSDGWLDILSANFLDNPRGWNRLEALWSSGGGSFAEPVVPLREGDSPTALASADFNGDGHLDVAMTSYRTASVLVLAGDGAGGFMAPRTAAVGTSPVGLSAADVDADGRPDLVVANYGSNTVTVLRNTCGP